jgi:DNA replication and repair protein RecF
VRCWSRGALDLPAGLVVLTGPNGAGKTSLVEAMVLGLLGVSPRTAREAEVVREGAEALRVTLDVSGPEGDVRREIGYAPGLGRRLALDGAPVRSLAAWRARGAALVFLPEELRSVKGPPAARRRHLDRLLEAAAPGYAEALATYGEALAQRNALLRRVRAGLTGPAGLAPWESRMAGAGAEVAAARRRAVEELREPFRRWLADLGGGAEGGLALEPSPSALADAPPDGLADALAEALRARREAEIRAGQTLAGPHRDDLWIGSGARDLRRAGSQGEQRTAVLALLLAHRDHQAARAARPILLLDDVLSELDPRRRALLLDALDASGQAVVTTADPAVGAATPAALSVRIENGRLVPS